MLRTTSILLTLLLRAHEQHSFTHLVSTLFLQIECPHRQTKRQAISSRLQKSVLSTKKKLQGDARQVARARERAGRKMKPMERMRKGHIGVCPRSCKSRSNIYNTARNGKGFVKHDRITLISLCVLGPSPPPFSRNYMLQCLLLQPSLMVSHLLV